MLGRKRAILGCNRWLMPVVGLIWFILTVFSIIWVGDKKYNEFDPQLRLSSAMMSLSMEEDVVSLLPVKIHPRDNQFTDIIGTIFHVSQGNCFCESLSKAHKSALNEWALARRVTYQNIELSNYPTLREFVPSTPAVIVLNSKRELVYLGPYSTGMGCFQNSGMVDERIKPYFESDGAPELNATIQSEAKGCYCAT
jgi:hypothetical protein